MSATFGIWSALCAATGLGCPEEAEVVPQPVPVALEMEDDGSVALPSGLIVSQQDVRLEPAGVPTHGVKTVRLRYVSAQLEEAEYAFDRIEGDFTHLCTSFGLTTKERSAPNAEQIIISISSQATTFGETAPNVVQYFDAFQVVDGTCIWEGL